MQTPVGRLGHDDSKTPHCLLLAPYHPVIVEKFLIWNNYPSRCKNLFLVLKLPARW